MILGFFFFLSIVNINVVRDLKNHYFNTVKLVMFACSKYCVFFIFSFMRVLINANQTRRQISETEGTDLCVF